MKYLNQKVLSATVSMLMTVSICHVATTQASDIDIYKLPNHSKMTLFLMFDTSGSMGYGSGYNYTSSNGVTMNSASSLVQDYNICKWVDNGPRVNPRYTTPTNTSDNKTFRVGNRAPITYSVNSCSVSASTYSNLVEPYKTRVRNECEPTGLNTYKCYDRLSRLKIALAQVLSSNEIDNSINIGLGQFSSPTVTTNPSSQDGVSGRVLYPAVPLTEVNREILINKMVGLAAWSGTPSAAAYGESGAYFLGANTYNMTNSGYSYSDPSSRNTISGYRAPVTSAELQNTCNGQGIYFLTDGIANQSSATATQAIMKKALGVTSLNGTGLSGGANDAGWDEIGKFSKLLRGKNIKTAVVGFGSDFPNGSAYVKDLPVDILDQDGEVVETVNRRFYDCSRLPSSSSYEQSVKNTCNWGAKPHTQLESSVGGFGNGGFYSAQSTSDIVDSIKYFIEDIRPRFKPVATGSPTLPIDALNPIQIQPYGYYANLTPKPQEKYQLWLGNLNKYHVYNGQLYDSTKQIKLILDGATDNGKLNPNAIGIWGATGMLGKIALGTMTDPDDATKKYSKRHVFTNRQINNNNQAELKDTLEKVNLETLFDEDTLKAKFRNDPKKNYWLNILGYNVAENTTGLTVNTLPAQEQRQLGAVMHSKPVLLTQEGKVVVTKVEGSTKPVVTTTDREDYLLFGTNQGMLHVVKAGENDNDDEGGKEVFTFVPHEMMEKQAKGFLSEGATNLGRQNLYYGIDGAWTAYTQYVVKADKETLTVKDSGNTEVTRKGLQWVYGGLRMGGRSYYALDLSDIEEPSLMFHINPDDAIVRDENGNPVLDANSNTQPDPDNPLSYMGQSWSKPTIAWVNWGGNRKLVMFVGGGYDEGYEDPAYNQDNQKGAGVYMFSAGGDDAGELLWWASANAANSSDTDTTSGTITTSDSNLKYSVVSQINAVDRDSDGLVDHLFFGDLGGQAFRIDLNNAATANGAFAKRVVRLYNGHVSNTGASPRFYEMPSFSVHSGEDGLFGVVALSSGNRSSPLAGTSTIDDVSTTTVTANDAVYVIYDNDVARNDLYGIENNQLYTSNITLTTATFANLLDGIPQKNGESYNGGWKYHYHVTAGKYKGMNDIYALDSMLYVNVYHKDGLGITGSCGSGVIGDTELYQFCLPTGKCSFYTESSTGPNKVILGGGYLVQVWDKVIPTPSMKLV
ncbi:PilC/PilY family type IV pilus protein [Acinetobacter haemolyticus]|uniref:PilC/PilY family type IV pilus protein n=1 Tax=Acinetobacter haemolyticus TaxID=29430 RepID=UPI0026B33AAC|nr:PilC/PilY family type IV pilus protein [Acinetobacter haemolyticus]